LKSERETEIVQMENIILELQLELFVKTNKNYLFISIFNYRRSARDEAEFRRKKHLQSGSTTPPKSYSNSDNRKTNSPPTPTNDRTDK